MSIAELLIILLSGFGITFSIVESEIMSLVGLRQLWEKVEFFKKLFRCSFCTGFYVGIALSIFFIPELKYKLIFPFACSGFCFLLDRIVILLDDLINKK